MLRSVTKERPAGRNGEQGLAATRQGGGCSVVEDADGTSMQARRAMQFADWSPREVTGPPGRATRGAECMDLPHGLHGQAPAWRSPGRGRALHSPVKVLVRQPSVVDGGHREHMLRDRMLRNDPRQVRHTLRS